MNDAISAGKLAEFLGRELRSIVRNDLDRQSKSCEYWL